MYCTRQEAGYKYHHHIVSNNNNANFRLKNDQQKIKQNVNTTVRQNFICKANLNFNVNNN